MKPYICNDPVKHDGEEYDVGDSIELEDKAASPLLAAGAIVLDTDALLAAQSPEQPQRPARSIAKEKSAPNFKPQKTGSADNLPDGEKAGDNGGDDGQGDNPGANGDGDGNPGSQEKSE